MDNFKFKLQKVLDIKLSNEEESKLKYSKVEGEKRSIEEDLKNLRFDYDKYSNVENIEDIVTQKITSNYLNSLSNLIDDTNEKLIRKEEKLREAREDLLNKQIDRKSLEKIKEKKYKLYKKEEDLKEQAINDEFAVFSYYRSKVESV